MTLIKDDQPQIIGMLWTSDEANAQSLATVIRPCSESEQLRICRTDDREIPFRLADRPMRFV